MVIHSIYALNIGFMYCFLAVPWIFSLSLRRLLFAVNLDFRMWRICWSRRGRGMLATGGATRECSRMATISRFSTSSFVLSNSVPGRWWRLKNDSFVLEHYSRLIISSKTIIYLVNILGKKLTIIFKIQIHQIMTQVQVKEHEIVRLI